LVARLAAFAALDMVDQLRARAAELFWHAEVSEGVLPGRSAGIDACFAEWFLQDYIAPKRGGPLLGEFADTAAGLSVHEEELLFALLLTPLRAFEVTETPGPRGAPVKDLLTGSEDTLGALGLPDGLIRSDVCVGRLLAFGRLRRAGISLLRFPPGSQGELLAYLRAAYGLSRPGRHVSVEDYVDGAPHLYHHFFLERARELGGRAHRTCRWTPFVVGLVRYRAVEGVRIRAALARQSVLERIGGDEGEVRYLWLDRAHGVALGTVRVLSDQIEASAETREDLTKLAELLEGCLRGLIQRLPAETVPPAVSVPEAAAPAASGPSGAAFMRRVLERWPDIPSAVLSGQTPREACRSQAGREGVTQVLLGLERGMARQKRLGRAWVDVAPLWGRLNLPPALPSHGHPDERDRAAVTRRERRPAARR
jgi:hypothetical protein